MCAAIIHENISLELGYYNEGRLRLIWVVFSFCSAGNVSLWDSSDVSNLYIKS